MSNESKIEFSPQQIEHLCSLHFINNIDEHLRVVSSIKVVDVADHMPPRIILFLEIYYNEDKVDTLNFDLHNYQYDDVIEIAKNIRSNEYILQEIDNFLSGGGE